MQKLKTKANLERKENHKKADMVTEVRQELRIEEVGA